MNAKLTPNQENTRLSVINFITAVGDWLSFFAMLSRSEAMGFPAVLTGFSVPLKALANAVGAATVPRLIARFSSKGGIVLSQTLSLVLSAVAFTLVIADRFSIEAFFVISMFQTLLKQVYDGSRETHSKNLSETQRQRGLQAQLIFSQYGAQFLGPMLAFALIRFTPMWLPLGIDVLSFAIAVVLALQLSPGKTGDAPANILRPLKSYLWENTPSRARLRRVLLSRATITWTGFGMYNYLLFDSVSERFGKEISFSTWTYIAIGLGGAIGATLLKEKFAKLHRHLGDGTLCFIGHIGLIAMILSLALSPSLWIVLVTLTIAGVGMSLNAIGGQTARRESTSSAEFPEIVGLEIVVGQLIFNFGACAVAKWTILNGYMTSASWIYIGAACFAVNGVFSLSLNQRKAAATLHA